LLFWNDLLLVVYKLWVMSLARMRPTSSCCFDLKTPVLALVCLGFCENLLAETQHTLGSLQKEQKEKKEK